MSAYFENPDARDNMMAAGLTDKERWLARWVEAVALARVKEILERMGVAGIGREDSFEMLGPKLVPYKISLAHMVGNEDETEDGWWIAKDGKAAVHIEQPCLLDTGEVRMRARFLR